MGKKFNLILNICIFAIGVAFIALWKHDKGVFNIMSIAGGILLILFSSCTLIATFTRNKPADTAGQLPVALTIVPAVGCLVLGIAMIAANNFFVELLSYLCAALLIIVALYKYWVFFTIRKTLKTPFWTIIIPSIIMVCGIVILAIGIQEVQKFLALIIGVAFVVYAIHSLLEHFVYKRLIKSQLGTHASNITNVDYEEIKDEFVKAETVEETPESRD